MSEYPEDVMNAARESAEANVENMCLTYRHDFGLKAGLRLTMSQIARHEVAPAIARGGEGSEDYDATAYRKARLDCLSLIAKEPIDV